MLINIFLLIKNGCVDKRLSSVFLYNVFLHHFTLCSILSALFTLICLNRLSPFNHHFPPVLQQLWIEFRNLSV